MVAEERGDLRNYLGNFNAKDGKMDKILFEHIQKRAGEKPKEKKKQKGRNNVEQRPVVDEVEPEDDEIDFRKPLAFTEVWHNNNDFEIVFTRDHQNAKQCESCKVQFPRGGVICVPHDIGVQHMERYLYPKKDANGKFMRMEPTWKKETAKFYCARKRCIIRRHPYSWKGLLHLDGSTASKLRKGHVKHLKQELHFSV